MGYMAVILAVFSLNTTGLSRTLLITCAVSLGALALVSYLGSKP